MKSTDVYESFDKYKEFKKKISNYSSDMAYISCLMAKEWLAKKFGDRIKNSLDVALKSQSAKGLDIELEIDKYGVIIGEIKNTVPCKNDGKLLGAQQEKSVKIDLEKLRDKNAAYKYFFVTNEDCARVLCGRNYKKLFKGIKLVLLSRNAKKGVSL